MRNEWWHGLRYSVRRPIPVWFASLWVHQRCSRWFVWLRTGPGGLRMRLESLTLGLMLGLTLLSGCGGGGGEAITAPAPSQASGSVLATPPINPGVPPVLSPSNVVFFRNDAAGGGDGTFSTPFNNFTEALGAVRPGETLFLFAGTGPIPFSGTLRGDIKILGEGLGFTSGGVSVAGGAFPRLLGRITLGEGAVVQGVQFESPTGDAVQAVGVQNLTLDSNRFANIAGEAVTLTGASGTVSILNNRFQDESSNPANGVLLELEQSQILDLHFNGNTFSTPDRTASFDSGLRVLARGTAQLNLVAQGNVFDLQGSGISLQATEGARLAGTISQNTFTQSPLAGVVVVSGVATTDNGSSDLTVTGNTFNQSLGAGISLTAQGATQNDWMVGQNTIEAAGNFGLLFVRTDTAVVRGQIVGNTVTNAAQVGIQYTSGTPSGGFTVPLTGEDRLTVTGNQISGSGVSGIDLSLVDQTHAALLLNNTTVSRVNVLTRATTACFGAGGNNLGGALRVNVENGFNLTFDDRGQTTPAVTFPGAGNVVAGPCNP